MRADARSPRPKWPWIAIGSAVLVIMAVSVWSGLRPASDELKVSTSPPPRGVIGEVIDWEPTGCLGGDKLDVAMVLDAQSEALRTRNGAVEFATSYVRWLTRYPVPLQEEVAAIEAAAVVNRTTYNLEGFLADEPNLSSSLVPNGEEFHISTAAGVWNLESYSADTAEISVGVGVVVNGEPNPQLRISTMLTLNWGSDGWRIAQGNQPRPTEELFLIGTQYSGGC